MQPVSRPRALSISHGHSTPVRQQVSGGLLAQAFASGKAAGRREYAATSPASPPLARIQSPLASSSVTQELDAGYTPGGFDSFSTRTRRSFSQPPVPAFTSTFVTNIPSSPRNTAPISPRGLGGYPSSMLDLTSGSDANRYTPNHSPKEAQYGVGPDADVQSLLRQHDEQAKVESAQIAQLSYLQSQLDVLMQQQRGMNMTSPVPDQLQRMEQLVLTQQQQIETLTRSMAMYSRDDGYRSPYDRHSSPEPYRPMDYRQPESYRPQSQDLYRQSPDVYNRPQDPYRPDPYRQPVDPYRQPVDPYRQPVDPYRQPVDPYRQPVDPYRSQMAQEPYRQPDPYRQPMDPYRQPMDPYRQPDPYRQQTPQDPYRQPDPYRQQTPQDPYRQPPVDPNRQAQDPYRQPDPYRQQTSSSDVYRPQSQDNFREQHTDPYRQSPPPPSDPRCRPDITSDRDRTVRQPVAGRRQPEESPPDRDDGRRLPSVNVTTPPMPTVSPSLSEGCTMAAHKIPSPPTPPPGTESAEIETEDTLAPLTSGMNMNDDDDDTVPTHLRPRGRDRRGSVFGYADNITQAVDALMMGALTPEEVKKLKEDSSASDQWKTAVVKIVDDIRTKQPKSKETLMSAAATTNAVKNMLTDIRRGTELKKTKASESNSRPETPADPMDRLLNSIRDGKQLRKVEQQQQQGGKKASAAPEDSLESILIQAVEARRDAIIGRFKDDGPKLDRMDSWAQ